jgi:hypothetical protein
MGYYKENEDHVIKNMFEGNIVEIKSGIAKRG